MCTCAQTPGCLSTLHTRVSPRGSGAVDFRSQVLTGLDFPLKGGLGASWSAAHSVAGAGKCKTTVEELTEPGSKGGLQRQGAGQRTQKPASRVCL